MRFFNFLLASDAVGGLGPPEGLMNNHPEYTTYAWIFLIGIIIIVGVLLFYYHIKNKNNNKGDK